MIFAAVRTGSFEIDRWDAVVNYLTLVLEASEKNEREKKKISNLPKKKVIAAYVNELVQDQQNKYSIGLARGCFCEWQIAQEIR